MIALYARVSTDDQVKGYSIGNQIDECSKKAGTKEVLIYKDEGISGEILDRPDLTRLRDDVSTGIITELICYDPDRLSRKLMHQLMLDDEFRKKGVFVKFVNGEYAQTPEGQLFFSMRGAISEFEKEKIKQRTKGGKIKKAKTGKVIGNYHLYGYDWDHEKETYVINEEQAKIIRMIFDYFTIGKGINGIAKHLTEIGVPTAKGGHVWHRQVVRQMLLNISYTGKHPHNRYDTEGGYVRKQSGLTGNYTIRPMEEWIFVKIPPIIEEEQFQHAQELLEQSRRRFAKQGKNKYLLSGLVRCKECKNTMSGLEKNWWDKKQKIYSDLKNTAGAKNKGCGNYVKAEELEEAVWKEVLSILNEPEKILQYKESNKERDLFQIELSHINKKIEKNKKGQQRLLKLVAMSENIDFSIVADEIDELQRNEKSLQIKYNQIETKLKALGTDNSEELIKRALQMKLNNPHEHWEFEQKQKAIRTLVKQIYVTKDKEVEIHTF